MKTKFLTLIAILVAQLSFAQTPISITFSTLTYTQDFNSLADTGTANTALPTGWSIFEYGTSVSANNDYRAGSGSSTAGDTYSFGTTSDRCLGSQGSNSLNSRYGLGFTNNSGAGITSFDINVKAEQWRSGADTVTAQDTLNFQYSLVASGINDTLSTWTTVGALMVNSPNPSAATGALDGNVATNQATVMGTVTVNIPIGSTIYFRWVDVNMPGNDDGLGMDDLSITFVNGTIPVGIKPNVVSTTPINGATGVAASLSTFTITFDQNIVPGTGNVTIKNITDATQVSIPASNCTVSGMTATVPGVSLLAAKNYTVWFDSACFNNNGAKSYGIYSDQDWNFFTETGSSIKNVNQENFNFTILDNKIIEINSTSNEVVNVQLLSVTGAVLAENKYQVYQGINKIELPESNFSNGIYFIKLSSQNKTGTQKIIFNK